MPPLGITISSYNVAVMCVVSTQKGYENPYMCMDTIRYEALVASRLRVEREKAKISQMDLANKAGLSQNLVYFIESGKRTPTLRTVFKLCMALNISPICLLEDTNDDRQKAKSTILELVQRYM